MKKITKAFFAVLVLMVGIFLLTGCGKDDLLTYAGTYEKEFEKYVGDPETSKNTEDEFTLVLNADGTGKSNRGGESYNAEWSVDGEKITLIEKFGPLKNEYTGTIKNGKIDLFNGDPKNDLTLEIVFNKK